MEQSLRVSAIDKEDMRSVLANIDESKLPPNMQAMAAMYGNPEVLNAAMTHFARLQQAATANPLIDNAFTELFRQVTRTLVTQSEVPSIVVADPQPGVCADDDDQVDEQNE